MKKYAFVLSLILGFTGFSNAVLSLDYEDDWLIVSSEVELIGGINFPIGAKGGTLVAEDGILPPLTLRSIGSPTSAPTYDLVLSGPSAIDAELPWDGGVFTIAWGDAVITPNPAGEWLRVYFPGYTLGSATDFVCQVDLIDSIGGETLSVYLIPEPASAVLLLLGAAWVTTRRER